ncbi:hypothetical protein GMLC_33950 [Geomonas limicola]|uniref:Fibronectin type-III domain-containing protein n=1 Tax=Geomonas limicola TaxID=2740186 RepID=A0A6V8NBC8_9BACT|nr:fibronectin type III domain-containing protein [Geomonas limicola]GFO69816.1 hypothetical protein GMLC_33950 [Geomonas limicola]
MNAPLSLPTLVNLNVLMSLNPAEALTMKDNVVSALTNHPFFKDIPLGPLEEAGNNLQETLSHTSAGNYAMIPQRDQHLSTVIKELTRVAFRVQLQALDENAQLRTAGLPLLERRTRVPKAHRGPVQQLQGLEVTNLETPGEVLINADSQEAAFGYQFQYTRRDPNLQEDWIDEAPGPHRGCKKIIVRGLDPLNRYSFRGRAIGDDGPGPWSAPVTIPVT